MTLDEAEEAGRLVQAWGDVSRTLTSAQHPTRSADLAICVTADHSEAGIDWMSTSIIVGRDMTVQTLVTLRDLIAERLIALGVKL